MLGWITLAALAAMLFGGRNVPTAEEVEAHFDHGQKFYASGAYDQAIDNYQRIGKSRSRLLQLEKVQVTVGDITAPLQEVAPYQIGNAYYRMGEEVLERAADSRSEEEQSRYLGEARTHFEQAAESFAHTESISSVAALRALARSRMVACWYKVQEYERTIREAEILLERYPDSKYVPQALYDIGWAYNDMEDYPRSIEAFLTLVQRFPGGYRASRSLFQIGESYFTMERYAEAVPHYQRLVDSQRLGQMSEREILKMKREKIAGLVDETALDLAAKALLRIGVCYEKAGDYDRAGEAFALVAAQFADEPRLVEDAYLRHADMHYKRGDFAACIEVYRRAIEAENTAFGKARMQLLLANRYFETEHYPEAVREYEYYRDTYPERAAQAGLPVEGVGLQIARAWFREAERLLEGERNEAYQRAESELRQTLAAYPGSSYEIELRFNLGLALQSQGTDEKLGEALGLYQGVIDEPDAGGYRQSALFQSARAYRKLEAFAEAIDRYLVLVDELADRPEVNIAHFELGVSRTGAGTWESAVESFLRVSPSADLFSRSRLEAGQSLVLHNQDQRALEALAEGVAAETDPESQALFDYLTGVVHSRNNDHRAALPHFDRAMATASAAIVERVAYARGTARFKLGQFSEAVDDLERTWTDPELASSASRLLASAYTTIGRPEEALRIYQNLAVAAEATRERGEFTLALAEIAYRQGHYDRAIEACGELTGLDLDESELPEGRSYYLKEKAFFLSADASIRLERFSQAQTTAKAGLQAYGDDFYTPDFLFISGLAALNLDLGEEAARWLTRMVERFPAHTNTGYAYYYLGYAYFNQTQFSNAARPFSQVVNRYPDLDVAPDALFRLADCRYNLRQFDEARQEYERLARRYPNNDLAEDSLYNLSWCLVNATVGIPERAGESQEAFAAYLARYPRGRHAATARYTLAEMSFNAGEHDRAHALFRQIQEEYPDSPAAEQAARVMPELLEALAYREYSAVVEDFDRAMDEDDNKLLRAVIPRFEAVWETYPKTSSGVGAKVNVGVCFQRLKEWERAVAAWGEVIDEGEKGNAGVTPHVVAFCERRRGTVMRKHL